MRWRTLLLLPLLAVGATACGNDDEDCCAPGPTSAHVERGALPELAQGAAAFVEIGSRGIPAITADGRVFVQAAAPAPSGFAAPAMAPYVPVVGALQVAQLTDDGLERVLFEAASRRLLSEPPDYGDPGITDQGSLTVRLSTANATYTHSVYAPGERVDDATQQAARHRLDGFVDFVHDLGEHVGDELGPWEPYVPEQWVVELHPYVDTGDAEPWPFPAPPSDGCQAFAVDGADTASGVYTDGDVTVEVRPALPFTVCTP